MYNVSSGLVESKNNFQFSDIMKDDDGKQDA
jgi:hypothetical protein